MPYPAGSIPITGSVGVTDVTDAYPTHLASLGKGGYRTVATIVERDAIPVERREYGMKVYCLANGDIYTLLGPWGAQPPFSNRRWALYTIMSESKLYLASMDFGTGANKLDFFIPDNLHAFTGLEYLITTSFFGGGDEAARIAQDSWYKHGGQVVLYYIEPAIGAHMTAYVSSGVLTGVIPDLFFIFI